MDTLAMMNQQPRLPVALQEAITTAVDHLDSLPLDEADTADILRVLAIFHPEAPPAATLTVQQQRLLLLGSLTFRQMLALWQRRFPHDMRATAFLHQALTTILQRTADVAPGAVIDRLWEQTEALQTDDPIGELIGIAAYTLTKAIDQAVNADSSHGDYTLETHVGVALRYMARAYVAHTAHHDHAQPAHVCAFWRFWFTEIVPRAWFPPHPE